MRLITHNPFRILGVFSNSPKKDMLSNINKMKAFAKVGKSIDFPLDLAFKLSPVNRDTESISSAQSAIERPADQIKHSLFWFMKESPIDEIAFNHLKTGDFAQAKNIWNKKESVSSLTNTMVCALIENDTRSIALTADKLFQNYCDEFCAIISDLIKYSPFQLTELFIESLNTDGSVDIGKLSGIQDTSDDWNNVVNGFIVKPLQNEITTAIAEAKKASGSLANYKAGIKLRDTTKQALKKLKELLGVGNMEYQMIADKLAQAILQCGINYFNDSTDDNAPDKAMELQSYALSIAVGQIAKERCKENVNILKEIGPEYKVNKEMERIANRLKHLKPKSSYSDYGAALSGLRTPSLISDYSLNDVQSLVNNSIPDLNSIKQKLGTNNDLYIKISTAVASAAINALVDIINKSQQMAQFMTDKSFLRKEVSTAISLMSKISSLDMTSECRSYLNNNRSTLNSINSHLNPSSGGCYIATMAYGSYDHPQVMVLRQFRDNYLGHRKWGKRFIKYYYKNSPLWVEHLKNHKHINIIIRKCLDIFVYTLKKQ